MIFNRKGVSAVVANVLIILLVVVGVALIWAAVRPSIEQGTEGIQADCLTIQLEPVSCVAGSNAGEKDVIVKRNPGVGTLGGLKFRFEDDTGATEVVDTTSAITLQELGSQTFTLNTVLTGANLKVNVAAVAGNGKICDIVSTPVSCS